MTPKFGQNTNTLVEAASDGSRKQPNYSLMIPRQRYYYNLNIILLTSFKTIANDPFLTPNLRFWDTVGIIGSR